MYYKDILSAVEEKFNNEWVTTPIHFEDAPFQPIGSEWVHLSLMPLPTEQVGYGPCSLEGQLIYVTCYAGNKVRCAELADLVDVFISFKKLGSFTTGTTSPVSKGNNARNVAFFRTVTSIKS